MADFVFPRKSYKTKNNITFKGPINIVYSLIELAELIQTSSELSITEKFRPDIDTDKYSTDIGFIKVMSLMNGKEYNMFSYEKDEDVVFPSMAQLTSSNAIALKTRHDYDTLHELNVDFTADSINSSGRSLNILNSIVQELYTLPSLRNESIENEVKNNLGLNLIY